MYWQLAVVVLVIGAGVIATFLIGHSKSNREENNGYFARTGMKLARLSGFYAVCVILMIVLFLLLLNR
ncbi:hypothetical protein D7Z26_11015 [Cohnella endophytica]|uniref:Uncharacterized protein n=1 Tax=Cohnella endophytica TaxID=2419778 RepID=A0A494XTJ4_9BACL|nr:hypothetical protein [Cohnella endophytica]RKP53918.1 hypothetical protein D7Z26_11015 [Cohnella endophytica]